MLNQKKINSTSKDYDAMIDFWEMVDDIVDGQPAIIKAGDKYLPQFPQETDSDYEYRLKSAKFTNVYRDVLEGLAQKPFAKEVGVKDAEAAPVEILNLIENIDARGNHLNTFAANLFFSGINKAIDWIFVDYTKVELDSNRVYTVEQLKQLGARPFWVSIPANKVIDVDSEIIAGKEQITLFKIQERKDKIKKFYLNDSGQAIWEVWQEKENAQGVKDWEIIDNGIFGIGVIPVVPFVTGRRKNSSWRFQPPMQDAAYLQIELYQEESNLKGLKTQTAYPMLAGNGVEPERDASGNPKAVPVGPKAVLYAPPDGEGNHGEWSWIIADANVLTFHKEDIKQTISNLRELGRNPLTAQSGNVTVITSQVAASKGNSAVQSWAILLKDALEQAFVLTAMWLNLDYEIEVEVFTDFGVDTVNDEAPKLLVEMMKVDENQTPLLSLDTFWKEMKRRNILSAEFNADDEKELLFGVLPDGEGDNPEA